MGVSASMAALFLVATQSNIITGSSIGPVIWQGVMIVLVIPLGGLGLWAYMREPFAYDEKTTRCKRRCRWTWQLCLWGYLLAGVGLFFFIFRSGI